MSFWSFDGAMEAVRALNQGRPSEGPYRMKEYVETSPDDLKLPK